MAAVTSILMAVGVGLGAAGMAVQYKGNKDMQKAQDKAEDARKKAMNLDAMRRQRQVIREMQVARATALANATAQGAAEGSALQGAYGQVSGQGNNNISGIEQQRQLGMDVFSANRQYGRASTRASIGGSLTSLGGTVLENREEIGRVGASLFA